MIIFENVSKKFGTGAALSDISFLVDKGEFVFLVGPTGSGKTTVLRLITRELFPTQGKVIVNNWDVIKLPHSKIPDIRKSLSKRVLELSQGNLVKDSKTKHKAKDKEENKEEKEEEKQ